MSPARVLGLFLLTALTFAARSSIADPLTSPPDTATGMFNEAGTHDGQAAADPRLGSMTYTYPFVAPAARGVPQPELALSYNSSSHDREAGFGWGLDLPTIELRPLSNGPQFEPDGTPLREERYTFNGKPLVKIGPDSSPGWPGVWWYYRLEFDDTFAHFYRSDDRLTWRVLMKGGQLLELGRPAGDGVTTDLGFPAAVEHDNVSSSGIIRWRLVTRADVNHPANSVSYKWQPLDMTGLVYLTDVYDTSLPSSPDSLGSFAHHIQLDWDPQPFAQPSFANIDKAVPAMRLARVKVASRRAPPDNGREVVRIYYLSYLAPRGNGGYDPSTQAPLWHHSFLNAIQEEGRCGTPEGEDGTIPYGNGCSMLPPTTFEYQPGAVTGFASARIPNDHATDLQDARTVFPTLADTAIVDFNRDGFPDVVQSTGAGPVSSTNVGEACPSHVDVRFDSPDAPYFYCVDDDDDDQSVRGGPARSMRAYLHQGAAEDGSFHYLYQCADRTPAVLNLSGDHEKFAFMSTVTAPSALGFWSEAVVAWESPWSSTFYPTLVRPVALPSFPPGEEPPNYAFGGCEGDFDPNQFYPRWRWDAVDANDWIKERPMNESSGQVHWIADIDGDGLADALRRQGSTTSQDLDEAEILFSRAYGPTETLPDPLAGSGPALVPFDSTTIGGASLVPSGAPRDNTAFYYVDMNGDGYVDLVTVNPNDDSGTPRIRPGNGRGAFGCDPAQFPCLADPSDAYEPVLFSDAKPWDDLDSGVDDDFVYHPNFPMFHDVTGDGLADIVLFDNPRRGNYHAPGGSVRVWVNLDGVNFGCVGAGADPCQVGLFYDSDLGTYAGDPCAVGDDNPDHDCTPTSWRMSFADMNADGVDDIVLLTPDGVYEGSIFPQAPRVAHSSASEFLSARAPRPGLLRRIDNGRGATTDVVYESIQELDYDNQHDMSAPKWATHSPVVEVVVTDLITRDTATDAVGTFTEQLGDPFAISRAVHFTYTDPAYDRWKRQFMGFRKVAAQTEGQVAITETTYWFGPCENQSIPAAALGVDGPTPLCVGTSDDDRPDDRTLEAWVGKPVRIDRYIPDYLSQTGTHYLSSQRIGYNIPDYAFSTDSGIDRNVTYTYVNAVETHIYDDAASWTPSADSFQPLAGGDTLLAPPLQDGSRVLLQTYTRDGDGTLIQSDDYGDTASGDQQRITVFEDSPGSGAISCTPSYVCSPQWITVKDDNDIIYRQTHLIYENNNADVSEVHGMLFSDQQLFRFHQASLDYSESAPGQAVQGEKLLAALTHDPSTGAVTRIKGPSSGTSSPGTCAAYTYDDYLLYPSLVQQYTHDCITPSDFFLETDLTYDYAFGVPVKSLSPAGGLAIVQLDPFGRPSASWGPTSDAGPGAFQLETTTTYYDQAPVSVADTTRYVSAGQSDRHVSLYNGLLEAAVRFDQGDDGLRWIVSGWTGRNHAGQILTTIRPWTTGSDPLGVAASGQAITDTPNSGVFSTFHDGFGRDQYVYEDALAIAQLSYQPLAVNTLDAEQIGGSHVGAHHRVEYTGRGQVRIDRQFTADGEIDTTYSYDVLGQALNIQKGLNGSPPTYSRDILFDSLGRLVGNAEPNTSGSGYPWRYAYDDANRLVGTSDSRGCGKNLYYDGLGRITAEDYSPCLATQAAYTQPNPDDGSGFEVVNTYDAYDADQVSPDDTFADDPSLAIGQLTSSKDRGSHTRYNYDVRGNTRRVARRVTKPLDFVPQMGDGYAAHWLATRMDYDPADRLTRRTSGVDDPDSGLLASGASEEGYTYGARDLVSTITSSYSTGTIVAMRYNPDGQPGGALLGDLAVTSIGYDYDSRRRLTNYEVSRNEPAIWGGGDGYDGPDWTTSQTEPVHLAFSYDLVGNPTQIEDQAQDWPSDASSQYIRNFVHDDLYRLKEADYHFSQFKNFQHDPFEPEASIGDNRPVPLTTAGHRVSQQTFQYDELGNVTDSEDDSNVYYDRSLGSVTLGTPSAGPNQLQAASGIQARYDEAGNLLELKVSRDGTCANDTTTLCTHWFTYDWDEVGQLARARRWDFDSSIGLPDLPAGSTPSDPPAWDLWYAYSGGKRVLKTSIDSTNVHRHTLEVFDTLRLDRASFDETVEDYPQDPESLHLYLGAGIADVFVDTTSSMPIAPGATNVHTFLRLPDHLGSTTVIIDSDTSEVVERPMSQAYGAIESDYRPIRWNEPRDPYKWTGKEEDIEVGLTYFGARYYHARLDRWISADPLTIHGVAGDLNPYAYVRGRATISVDPVGLDSEPPPGSKDPQPCGGSTCWTHGAQIEITGGPNDQSAFVHLADAAATMHVPVTPGLPLYIRPGDVPRELANASVVTASHLLDPFGIYHTEAGVAAAVRGKGPVEVPDVLPTNNKDPLNVTKAVVTVGVAVTMATAGGEAAAAEEVTDIAISRARYPEAAAHIEDAQAAGHPDVLTIDRAGAAANRAASTGGYAKVPGMQLDEYPPAMFQEGGQGASVRAIDPRQNMGAGACIGNLCRSLPNGSRVRIVVGD